MEKTLEVIDDFFIPNDYLNVVKYCSGADYYWGERDDKKFIPTGMVHEIYDCEDTPVKESNRWIYDLFLENTNHLCPNLKLYRMYVNSFAPGENPYFHTDSTNSEDLIYLRVRHLAIITIVIVKNILCLSRSQVNDKRLIFISLWVERKNVQCVYCSSHNGLSKSTR